MTPLERAILNVALDIPGVTGDVIRTQHLRRSDFGLSFRDWQVEVDHAIRSLRRQGYVSHNASSGLRPTRKARG